MIATYALKLHRWFQAKVTETREIADTGSELVTSLLNQATSPSRRADIHAYIQFRCTEMESSYIRDTMYCMLFASFIVFSGFILSYLSKTLDTNVMPWLWVLTVVWYVGTLTSLGMLLFYGRQLRSIQLGWQKKAGDILHKRAFRHVSET